MYGCKNIKRDPLKTKTGKHRVVSMNSQQLIELYETSNSHRMKDKARQLLQTKKQLKNFGLEYTIPV